MQPYIIFDRDGTLIKDLPYLNDPEKVDLLPNAIDGLTVLKSLHFRFGIITNQSSIGRGLASWIEVESVNIKLLQICNDFGINFDFLLICPHLPEDKCDCRKPMPKLGDQAISNFNIDTKQSIMVGDKDSDIIFGNNIGLRTCRIESTYSAKVKSDINSVDILSLSNAIYSTYD